MIKLLKKEFILTASPITYAFLAFVFMAFVLNYPIALVGFFICYGIFHTFQFGREFNDITYTLILPVKKSDVVKSKFLFTIVIQMIAFVLLVGIVLLKMFVLPQDTSVENNLTNANLSFLGYVLLIYAIFNLVFLNMYFKSGVKIGVPFLVFAILSMLIIAVTVILPFIPALSLLNTTYFNVYQFIPLGVGIVSYVGLTAISLKASIKAFDKVDL